MTEQKNVVVNESGCTCYKTGKPCKHKSGCGGKEEQGTKKDGKSDAR